MMPDWVQKFMTSLKHEIPKDFVGQIEVNVFKGSITNINIKQSCKEADERR